MGADVAGRTSRVSRPMLKALIVIVGKISCCQVPAPDAGNSRSAPANISLTVTEPSNAPPTVAAGGPYTVEEGGTVTLSATGSDPENLPLTYAWDLDGNGTYETSGQNVSFSAASLDGPTSRTVGVRATDAGGLTATDTTTVNVTKASP